MIIELIRFPEGTAKEIIFKVCNRQDNCNMPELTKSYPLPSYGRKDRS